MQTSGALGQQIFCGGFLVFALGAFAAITLPGSESSQAEADSVDAESIDTSTDDGGYGKSAEDNDPVKRNGPIFEGWTKPQFALMFSGDMDGFLEPCGCAGLDNQLGGLKRRHTLIKKLEADGWPLVKLDSGGMVRRVGPQSEIKYRYALESLMKLGYQAIGLGARELQLSSDSLLFVLANLDAEQNPLVSANISLFDSSSPFTKPYRVVEAGGKRIGITSILVEKHKLAIKNSSDVLWQDPAEALRKVMPQLEKENCDLLVLMTSADPNEAAPLAKQFPQFDLITTAGASEPPLRTKLIEGTETQLIESGHKGMYVIVLGIYDDPDEPVKYQRVPLDHRFDDSPDMKQMLATYQNELRDTGLDGLGITGVKNPDGQFVGSAACGDCHTTAMEIFEGTPHSHATETLVKLDPQRHFDPECLSCHATGWNPQKYFPYASGFLGLESTPHLTANGCENCHGPGKAHVDAELGETDVTEAEQEQLRAAMRLKIVENEGNKDGQVFKNAKVVQRCVECHDTDNSPDFDFQEYWPLVEHVGKD